jgi:hypothetical protein
MEVIAENRVGRRMLRHITALAEPRFAGSTGEQRAQDYITARFLEDEYRIVEQPFESSLYTMEALPRIGAALLLSCLVFAFSALRSVPSLAVELSVLVLLALLAATRWSPLHERLHGLKQFGSLRSRNIIAMHPSQDAHLNVLFTAHYDSARHILGGPFQSALFGALSLLQAATAALILAATLAALPAGYVLLALVPAGLLTLLAQFTIIRNDSPGAYDNASGVALLLELARAFATSRPQVNLAFIATGAGEAGRCGAVALMQSEMFGAHFPPERSIVINLDGIGSKGPIRVSDRYGLPPSRTGVLVADLCRRVCDRFGLEARSVWTPAGAALDHIPFAAHGYQAVTLSTAGWNKAFRSAHTRHDTPEHLDVATLELCFAVAQEVVDSIPART